VVDGHVDTHVLLARNQHQRVRLRHDRVLTGGGREREGGGEREGGREEGGNDGGKHFHSEGGTARDQASANPACVPPCCLLHVSSSAERERAREREEPETRERTRSRERDRGREERERARESERERERARESERERAIERRETRD
jgi:hypothetical protein